MGDLLNGKKIPDLYPATDIADGDMLPGAKEGDNIKTYFFTWALIKTKIIALITAAVDGIIKGDTGATGAKGDQGIQGEKGDKGNPGIKGDQGNQGSVGIQGAKGDKGDKGDQGIQGFQGVSGEKGDKGDQGDYVTGLFEWNKKNEDTTATPRDGAALVEAGGFLFSLGGWHQDLTPRTNSEVYRFSEDLLTVTQLADAPWEGRHTFGFAQKADNVYVYGGDYQLGHYQPNAWKGELQVDNTLSWTEINANLPWGNRIIFGCVTHNDEVYIIGGQDNSYTAGVGFGDVWKSIDWGVTWVQIATGLNQFKKNLYGAVTSFNGYIYVVSGGEYDQINTASYSQEVWRSADGISWEQMDNIPFPGRQYHATITYKDRIFVTGGSNTAVIPGHGNFDDTWAMDRHGTWQEVKSINRPSARHASAYAVYKDKLVISTGNLFTENNTWTLSPASNVLTVNDDDETITKHLYADDLKIGDNITGDISEIGNQAVLINGTAVLYGFNSPRSIDFVQDKTGGVSTGDNFGLLNFYGRLANGLLERSAYMLVDVGAGFTANNKTANFKFFVRNAVGDLIKALEITEKGELKPYSDIYLPSNSGMILFGDDVYNNPYLVGDGSDGLYIGMKNFPAIHITSDLKIKAFKSMEAEQFKLTDLNTAPSSATDSGTKGEIRITTSYLYVCIATDTWVRSALTSW